MNKRIAELSLLALIAFGTVVPSRAESMEINRDGVHIDVRIGGRGSSRAAGAASLCQSLAARSTPGRKLRGPRDTRRMFRVLKRRS